LDRFGTVARGYAQVRPTYPKALFDWLGTIVPSQDVAWDCATGTGQAARGLAAHFERVIATDASAGQVAGASPLEGVEYRVARAEDSGLAGGTADVITVAQALHWLDIERFYAECVRVLKPGGVLAVWTYGPPRAAGADVDALIQHYYFDLVGPHWPAERALVDSGYRGIGLPFPEIETPALAMTADWSLDQLLGYLGTWSATMSCIAHSGRDPIAEMREPLSAAWGARGGKQRILWPLTLLAGRQRVIEPAAIATGAG
jgi:SAM-dependent methyltransferase